MKTITTILIIIFLIAVILFAVIVGKSLFKGDGGIEEEQLAEEEVLVDTPVESTEEEIPGSEAIEEEVDPEGIQEIEIYLDGDRDNGIFLGKANYGLTSKEAFDIYGEDFSESGFLFAVDNNEYEFAAGSTHFLYIYTYIPEYGWEYIREQIIIDGDPDHSQSIELHIDNPSHNDMFTGADINNARVSGWSADLSISENTGINKIEVYLNGPKGFGNFLGEADYGAERLDVANAFGNGNYSNSGYILFFDASMLDPGSNNTLYVYSFSDAGTYTYVARDFLIEGEGKESKVVMSVTADFTDKKIEISGWAINKKWIIEGRPRSLEQEYTNKKIIFTSNMTGDENIFSMSLDGSELAQLTEHPGMDSYPAVSPDGKKIVYTSDIDGYWQLMTMNWDGTDKVQLTSTPTRSGYPTWSYDGRYIFYEVYEDGDWEIFRINTNGSNIKRITFNAGADDWHPGAHPFINNVIYESGVPGHEDIYIMDFEGNNIQRISESTLRKRVPTVSPDGLVVAFVGYEGNDFYIYTMDFSGENIARFPGVPKNSGHPDISPDNKYIIFQAETNEGNDNLEIYIMNMDGTGLIGLTNTGGKNWDPVFIFNTSD